MRYKPREWSRVCTKYFPKVWQNFFLTYIVGKIVVKWVRNFNKKFKFVLPLPHSKSTSYLLSRCLELNQPRKSRKYLVKIKDLGRGFLLSVLFNFGLKFLDQHFTTKNSILLTVVSFYAFYAYFVRVCLLRRINWNSDWNFEFRCHLQRSRWNTWCELKSTRMRKKNSALTKENFRRAIGYDKIKAVKFSNLRSWRTNKKFSW